MEAGGYMLIGSPAWKVHMRRVKAKMGTKMPVEAVPARARAKILRDSPATRTVVKTPLPKGLWSYAPYDGDGFPVVISGV